MSKMNPNEKKENASKNENVNNEEATNLQEEQSNAADEAAGSDNVSGEVEALQKKYNELNDSHLRLMAEFDNYRKRTMREKADLIKTGGVKEPSSYYRRFRACLAERPCGGGCRGR